MLGSKYFTAHPTVDLKSMVANLNIDIVHAIVPLKEMRVIGLDESDLGDAGRGRTGPRKSIKVLRCSHSAAALFKI